MIAFRNNLPLVEDSEGVATVFETRWLRESLERAAEQAGYGGWWLTGDLVESVTFYLAHCYTKNVIPEPQLEGAVRLALREIGYSEIARFFGSATNVQRVSLVRCLPSYSFDGLANFYKCLGESIENLQHARTQQFHFCDLQLCVRLLQSNDYADSTPSESVLRERIVGFVRQKIEAMAWNQYVWCSIS